MGAGFTDGGIRVWIETSPRHPRKSELVDAYRKRIGALDQPKFDWCMTDDAGWADLHAEMPLAKLLAGDDQQQTLQDFVRAALVEIKEAGIDDAIRSICGDTAQ